MRGRQAREEAGQMITSLRVRPFMMRTTAIALLFRALMPALIAAEPVVINRNGAWCWFQDERALVWRDKLTTASITGASAGRDLARAWARWGAPARSSVWTAKTRSAKSSGLTISARSITRAARLNCPDRSVRGQAPPGRTAVQAVGPVRM